LPVQLGTILNNAAPGANQTDVRRSSHPPYPTDDILRSEWVQRYRVTALALAVATWD
jgi:hypothetical protein